MITGGISLLHSSFFPPNYYALFSRFSDLCQSFLNIFQCWVEVVAVFSRDHQLYVSFSNDFLFFQIMLCIFFTGQVYKALIMAVWLQTITWNYYRYDFHYTSITGKVPWTTSTLVLSLISPRPLTRSQEDCYAKFYPPDPDCLQLCFQKLGLNWQHQEKDAGHLPTSTSWGTSHTTNSTTWWNNL